MSLGFTSNISYYLFKTWTVQNGGTFTLVLLFTIFMAFMSELAGHVLEVNKNKGLNVMVYFVLRVL